MAKEAVRKYAPKLYFIIKRIFYFIKKLFYVQKSYSQEGEDLVLNKLLNLKKDGFFVDVGAHHPVHYSNTFYFYKNGWSGINIDAMPGSMKIFNLIRKRDKNLEIAISLCPQDLNYYVFDAGEYNTFSKELAERNLAHTSLQKKITLKTSALSTVLDQYVPVGQNIDFFSVDAEGFDLDVLKSNNWQKYRPNFVLVEEHSFDLGTPNNSSIYNYLHDLNYGLIAKTDNTIFYKSNA